MTLPKQYAWLEGEPGPRLLTEFLKIYGTRETPGPKNNPTIMKWAKACGLERVYKNDATAWCGLGMAYVAKQAGWDIAFDNPLGARNWLKFGTPAPTPMLGDVMVFWRGKKSGFQGHVGVYVGEDATSYHIIGCNQNDAVTIERKPKSRFLGARRCPWRRSQPPNIRRVMLSPTGSISANEA